MLKKIFRSLGLATTSDTSILHDTLARSIEDVNKSLDALAASIEIVSAESLTLGRESKRDYHEAREETIQGVHQLKQIISEIPTSKYGLGDLVKAAVSEYDFSDDAEDAILSEMDKRHIPTLQEVEELSDTAAETAIEHYDFADKIDEAINEISWSEKICVSVDNY